MSGKIGSSINARQIKAARALLDWSQDQLAKACGLSIATIRKIESGHISPRGSTMGGIQNALESAGLEFIDPNGVRQKPEDITVYQGAEGAELFFNDVYQVACTSGGEIVQVWNSARSIFEILGTYKDVHLRRIQELGGRVTVKCILTEDYDFTPASYCQYRSLSKHFVNSVPFYVYGTKFAIILFEASPSPRIIVIDSPMASAAYRSQFTSMWDKATPLNVAKKGAQLHQKARRI